MSTRPFLQLGLKSSLAKAAARRAKEEGETPSEYLQMLVERDLATDSFDEALHPIRTAFAKGGMTDGALDRAVTEARRKVYRRAHPKTGK